MYKRAKGVEYASDYDTIKAWVIDRVEGQKRKLNKFRKTDFEQRDEEYWSNFYDN